MKPTDSFPCSGNKIPAVSGKITMRAWRRRRLRATHKLGSTLAVGLLAVVVAAVAETPDKVDKQDYEVRDLVPFVNTTAGGMCTKVAASLPFGSIMLSPSASNPGGLPGSVAFTAVNTGSAYKYGILSVSAGVPAGDQKIKAGDNQWKLSPALSSGVSASGVKVEVTAAARCAIYRITFPVGAAEDGCVVIDPMTREPFNAVEYDPTRRLVTGKLDYNGGWYYSKGIKIWYAAQPGEAPTRVETNNGVLRLFFKTDPAKPVLLKLAISLKGPPNAERHLDEIKGFDFEAQSKVAGEIWNRALSAVLVDDPQMTDAEKRTLYTAVYRTLLGPKNRTGDCPWDYDGPYYDDHLCIWDTFRSELPWLTLVRQSVSRDIVRSFVGVFRQYGYAADAFLGGKGDMIQGGDNVDVVIADALAKKMPGLEARELYEVLLAHATKSGRTPEYRENDQGWVPFGTLKLLAKGASGKTMEFAYNDFCVAQVAGLLGLKEDRRRFGARSERWSELWNAETESRGFKGFIQSRGKDGKWVPTEPYRAGIHPLCEHFYECDSWTYSLFVPHQAARLIELCGGPETFVARLANFGDVNGMENEPHFLLPYLFIYASRPDLTPTYTKKIRSRFNNGNTPGEEDSGAMSSWYLFTTMGFFPNAGQDVYLVNGPRYRKLTLQMEGGKKLIVEAGNAGPNNIHVRSLSINDKPWNQAWFTHDLIANGGKLTFVMSDQPTDWARTAPVPPSYRFAPDGSVSTAPPTATKEEGGAVKPLPAEETAAPIFRIGKPDGSAMEFALADKGAACESAYSNAFPKPVVVTVGPGDASSWPFIHPGSKDVWAGATSHVYTIRFNANAPVPRKLKLVLGLISTWQQSRVTVTVNGNPAVEQLLPDHNSQGGRITTSGATRPFEIVLPDGAVQPGENTLTIVLSGGRWMVYDYVLLTERLPASIMIGMQNPVHKMAGGIGASWHAVRKVLPGTMRGSAYGANPPLENTKAWEQIGWHAKWLGLDWIRVEFDQSMYEPERNKFDWDNEEMRTLYRILDWCETNRVDVFLTQQWTGVEWNKLPGRDAITSAPKSVEDFAEGLSTLAGHLLNTRKYTCIRWLCIANEPESNWWMGGCPILDGIRATRKALDAKGIALPLSGPDSVNGIPYKGLPPDGEFDNYVGAYDTHTYNNVKDRHALFATWSAVAHARKKPFFLSEFGINPPWGDRPKSYDAVLHGAETVMGGLAVGVDGFNRWSFLNRGDIDGQWQLVRTWDIGKTTYLAEAVPEPVPYMGYAMLTRFTAKHSELLDCRVAGDARERKQWAAALRSPAGNLTILLLNLGQTDFEATLVLEGLKAPVTLDPYTFSEPALAAADFTLRSGTPLALSPQLPRATVTVPARGIMTLTTFRLQPTDAGIIDDDVRKP